MGQKRTQDADSGEMARTGILGTRSSLCLTGGVWQTDGIGRSELWVPMVAGTHLTGIGKLAD